MGKRLVQFTAVAYDEGDTLGHALAWLSLVPQTLLVAQISAVVLAESARRRRAALWLLAGQVLCEALNIVLKRLLRHPRPSGALRADYGMPSSHAQFVGYLFGVALGLAFGAGPQSKFGKQSLSRRNGMLVFMAATALSVAVPLSRVYLAYHDVAQVAVGWAIGALSGLLWCRVTARHKSNL